MRGQWGDLGCLWMNVLTVQWASSTYVLMCCLPVTIRGLVGPSSSVMSSVNRMWLNGWVPGRTWWILFFLPMSDRYRDMTLMKRGKRRGDRTLPWTTPVLNVILTIPMSLSGKHTCSYKDFNRSTSGIPYDSKVAHSDAWLIELKLLLKSISTCRNLLLSLCVSLVRTYSFQELMSVLLSWWKSSCAFVRILSCSTSSISLSLMMYVRSWFIELSSTTDLQCVGWVEPLVSSVSTSCPSHFQVIIHQLVVCEFHHTV